MNPTPAVDPKLLEIGLPWWLDLITVLPLIIGVLVLVYFLRNANTGMGYLKKQSDFLDHQRTVSSKAIEQNQSIEDMIAKQYAETNARADRAISQSGEAIRLHAAALEQLGRMNATMSKLAALIETGRGPAAPDATPS